VLLYLLHCLYTCKNQLEQQPSKKTVSDIFARVTAAPSQWHKDMRHLYEGTVGAIFLHQQAESNHPTKASQYADILASDVSRTVVERLEIQLKAFDSQRRSSGSPHSNRSDDSRSELLRWDSQMFVCGLLDLLSQLASTFPRSEIIVGDAKALALRLIRDSDQKAFRYKAVSSDLLGHSCWGLLDRIVRDYDQLHARS
jgi:hypothetical protein